MCRLLLNATILIRLKRFHMRPFIMFLALVGCFAFLPQSASAQGTFICPNGPGPGERQVGMAGGGNGVAAVPVCVSDGPPPPPARPTEWIYSYYAMAGHDGANDVWTGAGFRTPTDAQLNALNACNQAMGGGCKIYADGANGVIALARDNTGALWWGSDNSVDKAKKRVLKSCKDKGYSCEVTLWTTSQAWVEEIGGAALDNPKVFPPTHNNFRKSYAAAAWVTDKQKWTQKVWISAGHATANAASEAVLSACNNDSGTTCVLAQTVSDTAIYVGVDQARAIRVGSALSQKDAPNQIKIDCKKAKVKCTLTESISAWSKGTWVHDPYAAVPVKK
jgi:hypothetical protein